MEASHPQALTVSALTAQVKDLLEGVFPVVWVVGEISNFSRPHSGHCYFTLKDDGAQIRAVMWRTTALRLNCPLQDGMAVVCQGHLDLYAARGSYQLVIDQLHPQGLGALELALRKLRDKLAAEGLFDPLRKRPLPAFPRRIGVVTSPTGAAIHDFLEVLRRRWRGVEVLVIPVRVQGDGAAGEIAAGIEAANRLPLGIDVLVVGRGGGSLEDLWSFNEEIVVRAIAASRIPVVSAVGHEIDVTLSDLVADLRALTPSEAAERVVPSADSVTAALQAYQARVFSLISSRVRHARARLDAVSSRRVLRRPLDRLHDLQRRLDELSVRASRSVRRTLQSTREQLAALAGKLETLSPLKVLGRGYSLTERLSDGALMRHASQVNVGESIRTRLAHGQVTSRVETVVVEPDSESAGGAAS